MNRLFGGTGKKKAPPPNLTDAIANVSCEDDLEEALCVHGYVPF